MKVDAWLTAAPMSSAGARSALLDGLPGDVEGLARAVQGLLIHEHIASAYGVTLSADQHAQAHLRSVESLLDCIASRSGRPLSEAREPGARVVGVCRHFTLLHVALLRRHGIAARARCGFGAYFEKGKFLDHWVTEYWNDRQQRWILVDAQLDPRQCELFHVGFDTLDVPRNQFLVAGDAWRLCRSGRADAKAFGILHMSGMWFIASNVIRDLAALNNHEMLPWDVWGGMTRSDAELDLPFIDRLAELSHAPDRNAGDVVAAYGDARVTVPETVFNAVLERPEQVR